jgi:hypothetical protein
LIGLNVSAVINGRQVQLSTNDYYDVVSDGTAEAVDWSVQWIRDVANQALEKWIVLSPETCPGVLPDNEDPSSSDDQETYSWMDYPLVWLVLVFLVLGQGGVVWIAQPPQEYEIIEEEGSESDQALHEPLLEEPINDMMFDPAPLEGDIDTQSLLNDMRDLDQSLLSEILDRSKEEPNHYTLEEQQLNVNDEQIPKSLLATTEIPEMMRYAIPIMIVATIVLLFSSNVSTGASVDLSLRLGENHIQLPGLFEFSLGNTVTELYKAGIYPLLFLVVVFSGIWPYAKLLWMLYAWIASYSNIHRREERFLTLDALSKFSLVDTYVLVVFLVAFRFHLDISDNLGLDVYVTPEYGFFAFLLATFLSLVLGHSMLYFHRRAQRTQTSVSITAESIFDHEFDVQDDGPKHRLSRVFQVLLFSCGLAATTFLTLGFSQKSFTFEFGGLAGMALGDGNRTSYSLLSLGAAIPRSVEDPRSIGVIFLQIAYYFFAVVTPVSCLIFLMILLMYPMTLQRQRSLLVAAEIANAWSAVEVFVLSIVAALLQISTFASFIIGDKCDLINRLAEDLIGGDLIPNDDAVCFTVKASVQPNCWYLVVGVLLNSFIISIGLRLAHAAMDERLAQSSGSQPCALQAKGTLARAIFRLSIGRVFFGTALPYSEATEEDEEAEEETPWQHWF